MADPVHDEGSYLADVRRQIDGEVTRRRLSGELPAAFERELDELFLRHAPFSGGGGDLGDVLRVVDGAAYVDPVVPVASLKSGGAVMKRAVRTLSFWYVSWITNQVSQFAAGVSRALHVVDSRLEHLSRRVEALEIPDVPVVAVPWAHVATAWWVGSALDALAGADGRVLHAAAGDGWLVGELVRRGVDAYGVDPRAAATEDAALGGLDLRGEPLLEHLDAVAPAGLAAAVLSGVVEPMASGQAQRLVRLLADRVAPGGTVVVHCLSPAGWTAPSAPAEADLAAGSPYRAETWATFLPFAGFDVTVADGPDGLDYLVVARRRAPAH